MLPNVLSDHAAAAQSQSSDSSTLEGAGIRVGAIWKSARDRRRAIQATLREYEGNAYADFRIFEMDAFGRMRPTSKGLTVSVKQLGKFAKLVGDTYRVALKMGLLGDRGGT
ncbi:transcriptional coactivator p15/PC4 family protein [Bradyrhizobium sp. Ai1a-2]|uniref:transcriptional coactivator p15/PC4 family protein n=1 Tax=Bradyrhizobium sp. Ai1a-2 TaxID=196490 RepID=UPI001363AD9C|nr:transcriptional coactivator p15/PC4 family protein [Bradyrhizobium sp. Ai1a-2]